MQTIHTISDGNLLGPYDNIWAGRVFKIFARMVDGMGGWREGGREPARDKAINKARPHG